MTYRDLLYDVSDHIATITLNRPERLNAISGPMLRSFSAAFRAADGDREVRAIILTGAGRGFCAGLDLKEQGANANEDSINGAGGALPSKFDLADAPPIVLHQTDKPVICALNGAAAGYGLDIALGCDIIVASDAAKLAAVFTKRGVLPESGGTWLLPRLIGWAKAAELAFTGRVLTPGGVLVPIALAPALNTDRTSATTLQNLGEGWLLDLRVAIASGTVVYGQVWAMLELVRGQTVETAVQPRMISTA